MPLKIDKRTASTPGRKPLFGGESYTVFVRVSKAAAEEMQKRANAEGLPLSTWIRSIIMKELEK